MFSRFQLKDIPPDEFIDYKSDGEKFYEGFQSEIRTSLEKFIRKDGVIDGTKLQNSWFPVESKFDVFLSHSHDDESTAIALAGFLKRELNLNTFIDSCLWGCSNKLLRKLDIKYCIHSDRTGFDYYKRNYSTSHVHMMLSAALSNMIDRCESVFFLNTPQSISLKEDIKAERTSSPWIYNELSMANIIRIRPIEDYRSQYEFLEHKHETYEYINESNDIKIKYDVSKSLEDFMDLYAKDLQECADKWKTNPKKFQSSLDYIYRSKGIITL